MISFDKKFTWILIDRVIMYGIMIDIGTQMIGAIGHISIMYMLILPFESIFDILF
jgi:hypothetical protein